MKTWEMIKELMENPEKKFYDKNEPEAGEVYFDGRAIRWQETAEPLKLILLDQSKWEEVKEPVTPMEAIKSGKRIKVKHVLLEQEIYNISEQYSELDDIMCVLSEYFQPDIADIFLNGEWYIED